MKRKPKRLIPVGVKEETLLYQPSPTFGYGASWQPFRTPAEAVCYSIGYLSGLAREKFGLDLAAESYFDIGFLYPESPRIAIDDPYAVKMRVQFSPKALRLNAPLELYAFVIHKVPESTNAVWGESES